MTKVKGESPARWQKGQVQVWNQTTFLPEMLRRLKQTLCAPGTRDPTETETDKYLKTSHGGTCQQWTATGTGALGSAELGMALALLEEVTINPTVELPELTQDWEIGSWREQQNLVHQDPGKGSSDPTGDCPRLACECPGVSSGCIGQQWPAAGLGALSVAVEYVIF